MKWSPGATMSNSRANLGFPGGSIRGDLQHPPIKVTQNECIIVRMRICKTKGVRTFGSTAAEIVCRGATLNTLSSFGFNCVYYALRVEG